MIDPRNSLVPFGFGVPAMMMWTTVFATMMVATAGLIAYNYSK